MARPLAARSMSGLRMLTGLAVLGALVLAGYLPVWYQMTHTQ